MTPVFSSTLYEIDPSGADPTVRYPRLSNTPNHRVVQERLADLEGAEAALVTASGMAAISSALLTVAAGGHVLVQDTLYGGTHGFFAHDSQALGMSFDFIDVQAPATWAAKLRPNTKAIYTETMSNPCLAVAHHHAVVEFARAHRLVSLIDNTFASPLNFQPVAFGYDLSLHSATKYINGHSDIVAGAVIGSAEFVDAVRGRVDHLGGTVNAQTCYLIERGLKTLPLRIREQNRSAQQLAQALSRHPAVAAVHYPGLPEHPQHERARELFAGFGGVLSADLRGGRAAASRLLERVQLFAPTPSLGGVESLVTIPARTSHAGLTPEERAAIRVGEGLVRFSVGIEDVDDLWADLERALNLPD